MFFIILYYYIYQRFIIILSFFVTRYVYFCNGIILFILSINQYTRYNNKYAQKKNITVVSAILIDYIKKFFTQFFLQFLFLSKLFVITRVVSGTFTFPTVDSTIFASIFHILVGCNAFAIFVNCTSATTSISTTTSI